MANDRMFIMCSRCGKVRMVCKFYPGVELGDPEGQVDKFVARHTECHLSDDGHDFHDAWMFNLIGESFLAILKGGIDWNADYWDKDDAGALIEGRAEPPTRPILTLAPRQSD